MQDDDRHPRAPQDARRRPRPERQRQILAHASQVGHPAEPDPRVDETGSSFLVGGKARAEKLTPERRSEIAAGAAAARDSRKK